MKKQHYIIRLFPSRWYGGGIHIKYKGNATRFTSLARAQKACDKLRKHYPEAIVQPAKEVQ